MTHQDDCTLPSELLEQVAEQGLDYLPELIRIVINTVMCSLSNAFLPI